jgi:hypothetical protein
MSLNFIKYSPFVMYPAVVVGMGYGTLVVEKEPSWKIPAVLCAAFWGFTIYTVLQEGALGVIPNHNTNLWGNQVWFDLLYSVGTFWFALMSRAKRLGMPILPWFLYVVSTASIGGLHMYARIRYLEEKQKESK